MITLFFMHASNREGFLSQYLPAGSFRPESVNESHPSSVKTSVTIAREVDPLTNRIGWVTKQEP